MEKEQQQTAQSAGLIYGLNDRPPLKDSILPLCSICWQSLWLLLLLR